MSDCSILVLAGPTASGKTDLAIQLASRFDAEIVGADSRQIYRGMPIGTAAPSAEQLAATPHHLVGFLDPSERYSAARYARDALEAIRSIRRRGRRVIVAGGTGFYIRALLGDVTLAPQYDEALRARLAREARNHSTEFLHEWLALHDRRRAAELHPSDRYRILRALEVTLASPAMRERDGPLPTLASAGYTALTIFLALSPAELDRRIAERVDRMLAAGFIEEAERIGTQAVAANAVGYPQALAYEQGWSTYDELRTLLRRATRQYARRQQTWFRSERAALWLGADAVAEAVREKLNWAAKRP